MATPPPSQTPPDPSGIRIGDVGGSVNFSALGDIVGGDKITTITTTIQISVEAVTQRPLITTSPYRGLDRFEDRDKDLFFGRDQLIKSLLAQLSASNVLLVLGASGSGKSSVVRAGLLPQLSQLIGAPFRYFTFVPDVNPFESLRTAVQGAGFSQAQTRELVDAKPETPAKLIRTLQRSGDQWLFFVDQFEEIFTVGDEKLRAAFIAALVQIAQDPNSSTKLVLAMRADFLDRFSPFPQFAKIIEKNIDFVADMHADELRQAIEQPAARHGVVFEQGLVEEIIKDVQGQAGSLPLLQYTLDLLWQEEAREDGLADRHLNTKAYRELGGVRGALQKRANEIYASFGDGGDAKTATPKQEIVRQIFLRLVDLAGEGSNDAAWRPVRRRASIAMFATTQEQEILQALINQKLLVSNREGDDATVEVAHEALFTSWGRLKNWIEAGKQVIFAKNRLADDARRWQRRGQEGDSGADEELLSGSRLSQALDMRARGDFATVIGGLGDSENLFLDRSAAQREKRARLRRILEMVGVALLLISVAGAIFGWIGQRSAGIKAGEARKSADLAEEAAKKAQLTLSQSDFLRAAELLRDKDPRKAQTALAFLARACRKDPSNQLAATRLFSLLFQKNWILPLIDPVSQPAIELAFISPFQGGAAFVTASGTTVQVWDAKSGKPLFGPVEKSIECSAGWLNPKEPWILLPSGDEVRIANFLTKEIRKPVLKLSADVTTAQFSLDGKTIITCDSKGEATSWDAEKGSPVNRRVKIPGGGIVLSRGGTHATGSSSSIGRVWKLDFVAGKAVLVGTIRGNFRALSADGRKVCSSPEDENGTKEICFFDAESKGQLITAKLVNEPVSDVSYLERVSFSADGQRAVSLEDRRSSADLRAPDSFSRWEPAPEEGNLDGPNYIGTGQLRLWEVSTGKQLARMWHESKEYGPGDRGDVSNVAEFSPDGLRIASTYFESRSLRLWDGRDGALLNELPCITNSENDYFGTAAFSPDGTQLITSIFSRDVQVWDIQPTVPLERPVRINGKFTKAQFSKNGNVIRLVSAEGAASDFLVDTGQSAPAPGEFDTPDPNAFDVTEFSTTRRFDGFATGSTVTNSAGTEEKEMKRRLVDVAGDKKLKAEIIIAANDHFKFSRKGEKLLTFQTEYPNGIKLLNAESGLPVHDTFVGCYNAWFSPDGTKVIVAGYHGIEGNSQGLAVVDIESGADLTEPMPYTGLNAQAVAFTSNGIVVAFVGESYTEVRRLDFQLKNAPALLADVAEAIAQHKLNDFGVLEAKGVTIPNLRELGSRAPRDNSEPLFANWLKWFLAPRESRPIAPDSTLTLAQYVDKYVEIASDDSLRQAEFLVLGNKELLAKLAAGRAKIAARREELRKAGNLNKER
jgi:WD40 repeat protein